MVRVLELVDQDVAESLAEAKGDIGPAAQQLENQMNLVAEVDECLGLERALLSFEEMSSLDQVESLFARGRRLIALAPGCALELGIGKGEDLLGRDVFVLGARRELDQSRQVPARITERAEPLQGQGEQPLAQEDDLFCA